MNDIYNQISSVYELYEGKSDEKVFKNLISRNREQEKMHNQQIKVLSTELTQLLRYNDQVESELVHLRHSCKRLEDSLSFLTKMRLPQAKNLVRLEEEVFLHEEEIQRRQAEIEEKEDMLKSGFMPSIDALFLELVKGFNIDFLDKGGMRILIRNHSKNDVVNIDVGDKEDDWIIADKIWGCF